MSGSQAKTNRSARQQCYEARDAFYQCVKECGLLYSAKVPIPDKCRTLRGKFEGACLPSWVKHFDELQEQQARVVRNLHATINSKAATSAGNLSGAAQK